MIDPQRPDYSNTPADDRRPSFGYVAADAHADPVVTIVTPFFNTGPLFHETALSVLRQSLQPWEWLIVNDGSTDPAALEVLAQYRNSDHRIRVIDLPRNSGPSLARNAGYSQARAPYVLQLDSDNLLEPTAAETWWWYLETHPRAAFVKGYSVGFGAQSYLWRDGFHNPDAFLKSNPVDATSLVRVSAHRQAGGYDESMRDGLEDWDFWLRCASAGLWGSTVPRFLDWYRRRPNHNDRWRDWDGGARQQSFVAALPQRFPNVSAGRFPVASNDKPIANATLLLSPPFVNRLQKTKPRLLLLLPWLAMGGSDKFNLDLVRRLTPLGWEITIATTLDDPAWLPHFTGITPDVFELPAFLEPVQYPRFLRYLLESRRPDAVLIAHSELAYHLVPFLRAHAPDTAFVDYLHVIEETWLNGGYPRLSVQYGDCLDLSIVSSRHLAQWVAHEGADPSRVEVCYTGGEVLSASDLAALRDRARDELGLAPGEMLVLYPARLCAQKQPQVFAETMRLLDEERVPFTCLVAGDGPDGRWLGAFLKKHRLTERVRPLGAVPPSRMSELMAAADVCFLPSTHEGVALTLFEAMSHGTVFVGADVGGQAEVVDEECGVLLPRLFEVGREAAAYAVTLSRLLRSPQAVRDIGVRAHRRIAERFSLEQMAGTMHGLLTKAGRLRHESPRPAVPVQVGDLMATRAIEHDRVARLAEALWVRSAGGAPPAGDAGWRLWIIRHCGWLEPAYAWGLRRGWRWLPMARERIRAALVS